MKRGRKPLEEKAKLLGRFRGLGLDFGEGHRCKLSMVQLQTLDRLIPAASSPAPMATFAEARAIGEKILDLDDQINHILKFQEGGE